MAFLNMLQALLNPRMSTPLPGMDQSATDLSGVDVQGPRSVQTANPELMPLEANTPPIKFQPGMDFNPDLGKPQTAQPMGDQSPSPPGLNYNNSQQAAAVNAGVAGEGTPPGGSANPGIYGLLPQKMQHGTLRNVLGAIGDSLLVATHHDPAYSQRMEQQAIGQAMAGFDENNPASVEAAIQRVAATGSPKAIEYADQLRKDFAQQQLKKAYQENTAVYREGNLDAKHEALFNRMYTAATGDLGRATSAEDYAARLARWDARIKAIDPNMDAATALGVPTEYDPTAVNGSMGMTSNQTTQHQDRQSGQETSRRNTDVNANARITAAGISGGAHIAGANIAAAKPTSGTILQGLIAKQNRGETLTPAEQKTFDHETQMSRGGHTSGLVPGLVPGKGGGAAPRDNLPTFTREQAIAASKIPGNKGKHFRLQGSNAIQAFH